MTDAKDLLTEFENKQPAKKDWFMVGVSFTMAITLSIFGYLNYNLCVTYQSFESLPGCIALFFLAGFNLSSALHRIIIELKFIRKPEQSK